MWSNFQGVNFFARQFLHPYLFAILTLISANSPVWIPKPLKLQTGNYSTPKRLKISQCICPIIFTYLSNIQIDEYSDALDKCIEKTINQGVPIVKRFDSASRYITKEIENLRNLKKKSLANLRKEYKRFNDSKSHTVQSLKNELKETNTLKQAKLIWSAKNFWQNTISNIPYNNSQKMFNNINRVFRPHTKLFIPPLKIVVNPAGNKPSVTIIEDESEKLETIGAYFQ